MKRLMFILALLASGSASAANKQGCLMELEKLNQVVVNNPTRENRGKHLAKLMECEGMTEEPTPRTVVKPIVVPPAAPIVVSPTPILPELKRYAVAMTKVRVPNPYPPGYTFNPPPLPPAPPPPQPVAPAKPRPAARFSEIFQGGPGEGIRGLSPRYMRMLKVPNARYPMFFIIQGSAWPIAGGMEKSLGGKTITVSQPSGGDEWFYFGDTDGGYTSVIPVAIDEMGKLRRCPSIAMSPGQGDIKRWEVVYLHMCK